MSGVTAAVLRRGERRSSALAMSNAAHNVRISAPAKRVALTLAVHAALSTTPYVAIQCNTAGYAR